MPKEPGVPTIGFETLLWRADRASKSMLKTRRREPGPGQKPVECYWSGHEYVLLYEASKAVDMPPLPPGRQRLYDANRTCATCGARSVLPWEKNLDGKRYCEPHQEPAAEVWWHAQRATERRQAADWARAVLADPTVALVIDQSYSSYSAVHAEDLHGQVLVDVKVFMYDDDSHLTVEQRAEYTPAPAAAAAILTGLAGRRLVDWSTTLWGLGHVLTRGGIGRDERPKFVAAEGDWLGDRYTRWVGKPSPHGSHTYRYGRDLERQQLPWQSSPVEQVAHMRQALAEMADLDPRSGGASSIPPRSRVAAHPTGSTPGGWW